MTPKITAGGCSFKGAFRYYLHDKGKTSRDRVAWTHTENLLTEDPDKAWKCMAWTAKESERLKQASGQKMTGRKLTKPVFAYSLSWHPEQNPDQEHMLSTAQKTLQLLGLTEHEAVIVAHRDEPQPHVHVIVNRVHPVTGIAAGLGNSKRRFSDFAREYEREHGKIYCPQREENCRKRTQGERTQYREPVIVEAWNRSDSGKGFIAALKEKGYHLAQGRKRLVVVDCYGQTHNPTRHLENIRAKQLQQRLRDIDLARLPDATQLSRTIQADNRRRYDESLRHDKRVVEQTNRMQDGHIEQRAGVFNRYEDRLGREQEALSRLYRLDEQKAEIAVLREKTKRTNWLKKLFGIAQRQQRQLHERELNRQNAEWRMQEKIGQVKAEREKALTDLKERQTAERELTLDKLQTERPKGYVNETEREKLIQYIHDKRQSRSRRGPAPAR